MVFPNEAAEILHHVHGCARRRLPTGPGTRRCSFALRSQLLTITMNTKSPAKGRVSRKGLSRHDQSPMSFSVAGSRRKRAAGLRSPLGFVGERPFGEVVDGWLMIADGPQQPGDDHLGLRFRAKLHVPRLPAPIPDVISATEAVRVDLDERIRTLRVWRRCAPSRRPTGGRAVQGRPDSARAPSSADRSAPAGCSAHTLRQTTSVTNATIRVVTAGNLQN